MTAGRGVVVTESHMAAERWSAVIDYMPSVKDLLWDAANKRPRDLWAYIYDDPAAGTLLYPPLQLTSMPGDEEGLVLGGVGILVDLGSGGIGPTIVDREYVSGANKLSNATFDEDDLYWVRAADGSFWVIAGGVATNAGGLAADDPLEYDRKFPTRPGHAYRAMAVGVTGAGRMRVRTIYEGRFHPANILPDWLAVDALTIGPIAKPQLFNFAAGPASLGPTMSFSGGALTAGPNPRPTYIADPGFETGTGWTDEIGPPSRPMSDDIDLANDPGNAASGSWVMTVGPITQHQVFLNADFGSGLANWYASSTDADPHAVWETDATEGNNGTACLRTTGWSTAGRPGPETIKYLRADRLAGGGVDTYLVQAGEQYFVEAYFKAAPGTEGQALISIMIPHPTVVGHDVWHHSSQKLEGVEMDDMRWARATIANLTIPANRPAINALAEIRNHGLGYWYLDTYTMTRTRGNRAQINSDTTTTVVPGTRYQGTVLMRSGDEMQVGSVRVGFILTGPGVDPRVIDVDHGSTDYEWTSVPIDFTPDAGYTTARRFVAGLDIIGEPAYIDNFQLTRMSNNSDTSTWAPVPIVEDQRYQFQTDVEVLGATEGSLTVGVKLTGPAVAPEYVPLRFDVRDNAGVNSLHTDVRPPPGYTEATLYAQSTDVIGGSFRVTRATLTKMDNNTAETVGSSIAVTPERSYKWSQVVRSGVNLQNGTVTLLATCTRTGHDDVIFPSSAMAATKGAREVLEFTFTPPSGYDQVDVSVIGTDVEGDSWTVGAGELRDTDSSTMVFDTTSDNPVVASPFVDSVAPAGAETVRVAVVVEQGSSSWTVNSVSLARTGVTPATGADIVADLLEHPKTGLPLAIEAGTITAPGVIPYDVVIQHRTNRDTLDYLCNVLADPPLEYRVLPTDPPTIDVGPAATVFTTHSPADALLHDDLDVEDMSDPVTDIADRPTEVTVLGAELEKVSGGTYLITATAQVPGAARYALNNRAMVRTKEVSDGTVDHAGYAQARAADLGAREAQPPLVLTAKLSGKDTRAAMPPGDTIYAYHPESGIEDRNMADPPIIEGRTVFPRAVRVLSRERAHGPSHRIVMRKPDGTNVQFLQPDGSTGENLPGVRWSAEDATVLTIGDRLTEWQADPQGLAAGEQYLRDRASRPR